ncbi:amino acid ABC transporter permease [Phytoactinopolyspora endophytica]|uniref:amino acid ABC transporter permease n=1 Tax=Phytoactinopolyspora endophytica TaxID=1642495 RepID=UPI00101DF286|nr:amino acid ABC transporter permease [Phytoactinopolyspora endophytica]
MEAIRELLDDYDVLAAFLVTIRLTVFSAIFSLIIGTVIASMRVSPIPSLRTTGSLYVNLVRNTPLTLIIIFCSVGLWGQLGVELADRDSGTFLVDNAFRLAVLGLSVYHSAFVAEALRSGINTVPVGQAEAARAIGLSFVPALRLIILPQAFRGAVAPLANVLIALTKNTTVASAIGVAEAAALMKTMIENRADVLFAVFAIFALGFVILVLPTGILLTALSRRLAVQR